MLASGRCENRTLRQPILRACPFSCQRLYREHDETLVSVTQVTYSLPARLRQEFFSISTSLSFLDEVRVCWRPRLPVPRSSCWRARAGAGPRSGWRLRTRPWPCSPGCEGVRASGLPRNVSSLGLLSWGRGCSVMSQKYYFFQRQIPFKRTKCRA